MLAVMSIYWTIGVGLGTGVAGFIANHARWFHSLLVGLILVLFLEINIVGTVTSGRDSLWWHILVVAISVPVGFGGARTGAILAGRLGVSRAHADGQTSMSRTKRGDG